MDFDDLIKERSPPGNRVGSHTGAFERHFSEGAVIVAYAMHLLRTEPVRAIRISPDGEHGKRFDFRAWLARRGFDLVSPTGTTSYAGQYEDAQGRKLTISLVPGAGDVLADLEGGGRILAECKGGVVNSKHAGQASRLRRGLCEVVGLLMAAPGEGRQIAVVPRTDVTARLAERLAPRCRLAGIEIALVGERGEVIAVP